MIWWILIPVAVAAVIFAVAAVVGGSVKEPPGRDNGQD
jgi:hypothetical protein